MRRRCTLGPSGKEKANAYPHNLPRAEARSSVKPVIIPQLVDLNSFATVGGLQVQRHGPGGREERWRLVTSGLALERECTRGKERRQEEREGRPGRRLCESEGDDGEGG